MGDQPFLKLLKQFPEKYAWQSVNTGDFRRMSEELAGSNLQYFFIQWIESSGAPEFKLDYTVFRTQKGFRIVGKVSQDLDTFRMPVDLKIETEGNPLVYAETAPREGLPTLGLNFVSDFLRGFRKNIQYGDPGASLRKGLAHR